MRKAIKKRLKKIFLISSCICLGIILLSSGIILYIYFNKNTVRNFAEKWASEKLNAFIDIGSLDYSLFPFRIQAKDILFRMDDQRGGIELSISHLRSKGDIISLIGNKGQFFDSIEINGIDLDVKIIESKDNRPGTFDQNQLIEQLIPLINFVSRAKLEDLSISIISNQGHELNLWGADLIILSRSSGDGFDFTFSSQEYKARVPSPESEAKGILKLTGHINQSQSPFLETDIHIVNQTFSSSQPELSFFPESFIFNASIESDMKDQVKLSDLFVDFPQICELTGDMNIDLTSQPVILFHPHIRLLELKNILVLLHPYLPSPLLSLTIDGAAEVDLRGRLIKRQADFEYSVNGDLLLHPSRLKLKQVGISSSALLSANISFEASKDHEKFNGDLTCSEAQIKGDNWECKGVDVKLPLTGSRELFQITDLVGTVEELFYAEKNRLWEQKGIEIKGNINGDIKKGIFDVQALQLNLFSLGEFNLQARFFSDPTNKSSFHLKSPELLFSDVMEAFRTFVPEELKSWEPNGKLMLELNAIGRGLQELELQSMIDINELNFHDPSFSIAGESISLSLALKTGLVPGNARMPFFIELSLPQGETLLKTLYIKWDDHPIKTHINGDVDVFKKILKIDNFDLQSDSLGQIKGSGQVVSGKPLAVDLSLEVTRINPGRLMDFFGQEINEDPQNMQITGEGDLHIDIRKKGEQVSLRGNASFRNGFFEDRSKKMLLSGLELDLPFFLEIGISTFPAWKDFWFDRGSLKIENVLANDLKLEMIQLELLAAPNLFLFKPVQVGLLGGTAYVYNSILKFDRNLRSFNGALAFSLKDGKIEQLVPMKQDLPLTGTFHINMPRITINKRKISTEGDIRVEIFQGTASIGEIMIDRPFSKNRTLFCDIEFRNFNLEKVTDSLPFGKVTGFVEGGVNDLAVSYGQPEQFSLWIDSVKKKGVPQKFSMKAVDDISILSSGEKTSMGSARLLSYFVSSFRYKEIGIFCSLKNDNFTLRGNIKEKGKEFLVKKDWIFGISVVNAEPDNQISFKDMLSRLKRIGKSQ